MPKIKSMRSSIKSLNFFKSNRFYKTGFFAISFTALLVGSSVLLPQDPASATNESIASAASSFSSVESAPRIIDRTRATTALAKLAVKGRAPKTGYARELFSDGWGDIGSCDLRNFILARDLVSVTWRPGEACMVETGILKDPYTTKVINFKRGVGTSIKVQIDHVVAVSDAWQKGAQQWSYSKRHSFYNDPLNLLAVDGPTNSAKGDGDAATWLPPNKTYRCAYVARQIAVKTKYQVWVTSAEKSAMATVLSSCPGYYLPTK